MNIHDDLYAEVTPDQPFLYHLWEPEGVAVVIGNSQRAEREVRLDACRQDGVPILRRRGGGGAVVLMPGVLCLTTAFLSNASPSPYFFFKKINEFIIRVLGEYFSVRDLHTRGISDIAIGERKILGCSIFKSRNLFFYQGSLLVSCDPAKFSRYLCHPSSEPDYRHGRGHESFVTTLRQSGYALTVDEIKSVWDREIARNLAKELQVLDERVLNWKT